MNRDLTRFHQALAKADHKLEQARRSRKFDKVGVQVRLRQPLESEHLIELTAGRGIVDLYSNGDRSNDKPAEVRELVLKMISAGAQHHAHPPLEGRTLDRLEERQPRNRGLLIEAVE